ncbi:hypothetical protein GCM10019016_074030 [Streptomyces prasinosporus]|uniref:Uncharacterized protein n=1 Tax=Streptomyces prasinosporus TaxID=68256 RepID=A0ABP6TYS4_9ACTN
MTERIVAGVPLTGAKLSAATNKRVKAYEDARAAYVKYTSANRDCATPKAYSPFRGDQSPKPAALVNAEKELEKMDAEALAKGQSLTDKDEFLASVHARIDEYKRAEPLLRRAMETAEEAAIEAVRGELSSLSRQAMDAATEAKKAYEEALEKVQDAEAVFRGHMKRFIQYVTGGQVQDARFRGLYVNEAEKYLSAWDVENGRLSWDGAFNLGLVGPGAFAVETVDLTDFINPREEEMTPWVTKRENSELNGNRTQVVWNPANYSS